MAIADAVVVNSSKGELSLYAQGFYLTLLSYKDRPGIKTSFVSKPYASLPNTQLVYTRTPEYIKKHIGSFSCAYFFGIPDFDFGDIPHNSFLFPDIKTDKKGVLETAAYPNVMISDCVSHRDYDLYYLVRQLADIGNTTNRISPFDSSHPAVSARDNMKVVVSLYGNKDRHYRADFFEKIKYVLLKCPDLQLTVIDDAALLNNEREYLEATNADFSSRFFYVVNGSFYQIYNIMRRNTVFCNLNSVDNIGYLNSLASRMQMTVMYYSAREQHNICNYISLPSRPAGVDDSDLKVSLDSDLNCLYLFLKRAISPVSSNVEAVNSRAQQTFDLIHNKVEVYC